MKACFNCDKVTDTVHTVCSLECSDAIIKDLIKEVKLAEEEIIQLELDIETLKEYQFMYEGLRD